MRNPRRRGTTSTSAKREIGGHFIEYLKERNLIRTWYRSELAPYYQDFRNDRREQGLSVISFSTALYVLGRVGIRELHVRRGTIIVFRGTEDFRKRSEPTVRKLSSQFVDIRLASERTVEWRRGHIKRKFLETSLKFSCIELELFNTGVKPVCLESCKFISRSSYYEVEFNRGAMIQPSSTENIAVRATDDGEIQTTELEICLKTEDGHIERILRYLRFEISDELDEADDSEQRFQQSTASSKNNFVSFAQFVPGEKPDVIYQNKLKMEWPLLNHTVPKELKSAVDRGAFRLSSQSSTKADEFMRDDLCNPLANSNYRTKFKMLLYVEEYRNQLDIRRYDMKDATLSKEGNLLYLNVPGLAEKRPSVLRGDRVYVKPCLNSQGDLENTAYEGYVHHVEQERVGLGFAQRLRNIHIKNMRYFIRFDFNRLALKLMQRSTREILSRVDSKEILFPTRSGNSAPRTPLQMYNRLIKDNPEQTKAVEMIASGNTPKVFIIFGPPGTGKTITMVEAIHQTLRSNRESHMLVCAPSNSACDLLTSRLLKHVDAREILRMHAASRNWREVPSDVKDVSNYEDGEFSFPAKDELKKCRIIVTTLITAGRIASAKFPTYHFNYVFIDEAGQAMEPEAMVAVAGVLADDGKIVMAGDPKQLGPVIRSPLAVAHGLQLSYLERLMTTSQVHSKAIGGYDDTCVVKLLKNYRSHESIIHVPNKLFYDNELQVCADVIQRESLSQWDVLPKTGFPVIFHGVQGDDRQDSNSPSYYNTQEMKQVQYYVDELLNKKGTKVRPEEIGIISPYRRQVVKIRQVLKNTEIKVGSVEEFQGQERRVIIVSTVRSNTKHMPVDEKFNLGFLQNPKRFNVAVTRAKSLLIIIGNPRILCYDKQWRELLRYCKDEGGYTGVKVDVNTIVNEISLSQVDLRMRELTLSEDEYDEPNIDQNNPQWRQDP